MSDANTTQIKTIDVNRVLFDLHITHNTIIGENTSSPKDGFTIGIHLAGDTEQKKFLEFDYSNSEADAILEATYYI